MSEAVLVSIILRLCAPFIVDGSQDQRLMCFDALTNCAVGKGGLILKQDAFQNKCIDNLPQLMDKERKRDETI